MRTMQLAVASLGAAWLAASPALAAEGGDANIFAGDLGNAIWTVVIFVVVLLVLGKYAWGPMLDTLQKREEFIRDSLATAKKERDEAETRIAEYTKKLDDARAEASEIVEEGRRDAEEVRRRIEEEARHESDKILDRAKREIDLAKQTAVKELYATSATLATDMASKILQREVSAADQERLIEQSLAELDGLESN